MRANGVPVEYAVFDDEGHGFTKKKNRIQGDEAILRFLDEHLKGASPRQKAAKSNLPRTANPL